MGFHVNAEKTMNPTRKNEENRTDKLCIYSSLNDAQKYFEILQEIRKEIPNIQIKYQTKINGNNR